MSDRDDRQVKRADEGQPVIPDGGLSSSMPAWLTERPRWAAAPTKETPPPVKPLPPPDTSRIELTSILDVTDLPGWLQDVARRVEQHDIDDLGARVGDPGPEAAAERLDEVLADAGAHERATEPQPESPVSNASAEAGPPDDGLDAGSPLAGDGEVSVTAVDVEGHVAIDDVGIERPALDGEESVPAAPDGEAGSTPGGIGGQRPGFKGQPVDWAAVRQEAVTGEREPLAASNPLLAMNPPVRVDPADSSRDRSVQPQSGDARPWWMSDIAIGVLLVAFILTMIYVVLAVSGVL